MSRQLNSYKILDTNDKIVEVPWYIQLQLLTPKYICRALKYWVPGYGENRFENICLGGGRGLIHQIPTIWHVAFINQLMIGVQINKMWVWAIASHQKVVARRSSVSCQMASIFLSNNITFVYKFHTSGRRDHHKPFKVTNEEALYIMYVNYMPILIFGSSFDVYK